MVAMIRSLAVAVLIVVLTNSAAGDLTPGVTYIYGCNAQQIASGDPFLYYLSELLVNLEVYHGKQQFTPFSGPAAYGDAECPYATSDSDCTDCLSDIGDNVFTLCGYEPIGVTVTSSANCYLRYEQYSF